MATMSDSPVVMLAARRGAAVKAVPLSGWIPSEMEGRSSATASVERLFAEVPAVYRCVTLRAEAVSSVPFEIVRAGTATRALKFDQAQLEHKLPDLLYRMEESLCLYGAAYLMPLRNRVKLLDVRYLAAPTMTPKYDKQQGLAGFERAIGEGSPKSFKVEEIVHVFLPDGTVEMGPGKPPIEAARTAAQGMLSGDTYVAGFFEHGGMNITLLITDPSTSEPELKKLETWWRRLTRGVKQMWNTVALRKNVEVKQLGYPLDQLAMDKTEAGWLRKVANAFGVPEYYLSSEVANFATAKSYDLTFMERVITAELRIIGGALNAQLFRPLGYELVFHPGEQLHYS
jgi:HK97 family phage portal protein